MLSLWRLQMLRELSVLGTISAVAATLKLTRPAVSQQLATLERETGIVLFERSGRGVELTAAGRHLVARAHPLFELVEEIEAELAQSTRVPSGEVRLAAFSSFATGVLPLALDTLARDHPQLEILFSDLEPAEGLRAAAAKQVDLAVVDDLVNAGSFARFLEFHPLCVDRLTAIVAAGHRLAGRRSIQLNDLSRDRWSLDRAAVDYHRFLINACQAAGFTPRVVSSCRNTIAMLEMVRTGRVVTVAPGLALVPIAKDHDFCLIPIRPLLNRRISVVLPKGNTRRPAIAVVLAGLDRAAARMPHLEQV